MLSAPMLSAHWPAWLPVLLPVLLPLPITLAAAAIDLRRRIIPDLLNLALLGLGLAVAAWEDPALSSLAERLAQVALAFGLFWALRALHARLRGRIGIGLGDVKFIAAATAWIGLVGLPLLILTASLAALVGVLVAILAGGRIDRAARLPFGPFLALGLHAVLAAEHAL